MSTNSSNDSCILAIIGDGSVGKSSLIAAFRNDNFQKIYKQTIGCDFYEKIVTLSGRTISLRVWDIGGQSMNSKNLPEYLSSSDLVFIVYDVTNSESFANVEDWLALAMKYSPQADMHIVGNKVVCECVSV
jgi:Ras-related protein Rab-28